jgi:hypothetical protein
VKQQIDGFPELLIEPFNKRLNSVRFDPQDATAFGDCSAARSVGRLRRALGA